MSKRRIFERYFDALKDLPLSMNPEQKNTVNGYWMPTIVLDEQPALDRDKLLAALDSNGIDARVFFWPLSDTGHFSECRAAPIAHSIYCRGINLPSYHDMTEEEQSRVVSVILGDVRG